MLKPANEKSSIERFFHVDLSNKGKSFDEEEYSATSEAHVKKLRANPALKFDKIENHAARCRSSNKNKNENNFNDDNDEERSKRKLKLYELVKSLDLSGNQIKKVTVNMLVYFQGLNSINLEKNEINQIDYYGFRKQKSLHILNLTSNNLRMIFSRTFQYMPDLKYIYLGHNQLEEISHGMFKTQKRLKVLSLDHNRIDRIAKVTFRTLCKLTELYLNDNSIANIEDYSFSHLCLLRVLRLDGNRLKSIERHLFDGLYSLQVLYLHNNQINHVDSKSFASLSRLRVLSLNNNNLTHLDENLFECAFSIQELYINQNKNFQIQLNPEKNLLSCVKIFHLDFSGDEFDLKLPKIRELEINRSYFKSNPLIRTSLRLNNYPELSKMSISNTKVDLIYEENSSSKPSLSNIKYLDLSNSYGVYINHVNVSECLKNCEYLVIDTFDLNAKNKNFFENLTKLKKLKLNVIEEINDENFMNLNGLDSLHSLDLSNNLLREIKSDFAMASLNLTDLNLSKNELSIVKFSNLKHFKNLKRLDMSNNYIDQMIFDDQTTSLGSYFSHLEFLSLEKCNLSRLKLNQDQHEFKTSTLFKGLTSLKELKLDGNTLESLDDGQLDDCEQLQYLSLSKNSLERFGNLEKLSSLVELNLSENKLESFDLRQTKIRRLDLSHNKKLKQIIVDEICNSSNQIKEKSSNDTIEYLNMQNTNLKEVKFVKGDQTSPVYFLLFSKLSHLDLSENVLENSEENCLRKLFLSYSSFKNLKSLSLNKCSLESKSILSMLPVSIEKLYMSENSFKKLKFFNLNLKLLDLSKCESLEEFSYLHKGVCILAKSMNELRLHSNAKLSYESLAFVYKYFTNLNMLTIDIQFKPFFDSIKAPNASNSHLNFIWPVHNIL